MPTQLITALDFFDMETALANVDRIGPDCAWHKVGKQLFTSCGPEIVARLKAKNKKIFLDMKYHDIPNTVAQAVTAAAKIGADLCNVHASGGPAMLEAAAKAGRDAGITVIAVTVLTSMDAAELAAVGINASPAEQVARLAELAQKCGIAGVVCSALELPVIRKVCGPDFLTVVPGIRPATASKDDQKRVMTPAEAAAAGADFIVVGRPITKAEDPAAAAAAIQAELASVK
ncbi:MAG: orotidine-5'-phosphate decarboxylase [Victivallales bacterium]|nr:orotidine-5'-phosphate decarboxylase [Victivallales bacterium]